MTVIAADSYGMTELSDLTNDENVTILVEAYRAISPNRTDESRGWTHRIDTIKDWDAETVATAHGMAIAADLLEVQVEDTTSGLRYRPRKAA